MSEHNPQPTTVLSEVQGGLPSEPGSAEAKALGGGTRQWNWSDMRTGNHERA